MKSNEQIEIMNIAHNLSMQLQGILHEDQQESTVNLQQFLQQQKFEEIEILRYLGNYFKITPSNVSNIRQNSSIFPDLQKACIFYEEIIDNSDIEQQNYINILVLNHLLTTVNDSNASLYAIYANLFLVEIDILSFHKIAFTHCLGLPHSIYSISLFVKECNDINDNKKIIRESFLDCKNEFGKSHKWEVGTFGYFLYRFELIEKSDTIYYYEYDLTKRLNDTVFLNDQYFHFLREGETSDGFFNCILNDDVGLLGQLVSMHQVKIDQMIKKPKDISQKMINAYIFDTAIVNDIIYWPFGEKDKISIIELAAFSKSLKVFKYMVLNHAEIGNNLIDYAIAGGDFEIIHTCQQLGCKIRIESFEMAVRYYHNEIFIWLIDNNPQIVQKDLNKIASFTIKYSNPQCFSVLLNSFEISELSETLIISINFIQREWIRFFIGYDDLIHKFLDFDCNDDFIFILFEYKNFRSLKILNEELHCQIDLTIKSICERTNFPDMFKYFSLHSIEYFFKEKGEIEKYKDELILPPFSNKMIFNYLKDKKANYYFFITHNESFLLFLIKNKVIDFSEELKVRNLCQYAIYYEDFDFLETIQKVYPEVSQIAFDMISYKNWFNFFYASNGCKSFIFDHCLRDTESNRSFQTEGLHYACFFGDLFTVDRLLKRKFIDVNSKSFDNGRTPLNLAAECNFIEIVYLLMNDERVDVNSCSDDNETSFYSAVDCNYIELVDLFLKSDKIDINKPDKKGKRPFLVACEKGYDKIVQRMLARTDLLVNEMDENNSPFGLAVENWNFKVVDILMKDNRVRYQQANEKNPLHRACFRCNLKMVKILFSIESIDKNEKDDIFRLNFFN